MCHHRSGQVRLLLASHRLGYLLGTFFSGKLYNKLNGNRFMAVLLLGISISVVMVATMQLIWLLMAVCFVLGGSILTAT